MAGTQQGLDQNYKPIPGSVALYDPVGAQYVAPQAGNVSTGSDGTPYAPQRVFPVVGTPLTASATGAAAATAVATLAGTAGKTTYITGFACTSGAPGAAVSGVVTVTGTISGTLSYQFVESTTFGGELIVSFPTPIPASAANTAIVVTIPAITSGAVVAVAAYGYQL